MVRTSYRGRLDHPHVVVLMLARGSHDVVDGGGQCPCSRLPLKAD